MTRTSWLRLVGALCLPSVGYGCGGPLPAEHPRQPPKSISETSSEARLSLEFDRYLKQNPSLSFQQISAMLGPSTLRQKLSFDPAQTKYYEKVSQGLSLSNDEQAKLRQHGLVIVDAKARFSMGSMYHTIYAKDLPVLVTTDSIMHALHRSFDSILMSMEQTLFLPTIQEVLTRAHDALDAQVKADKSSELQDSYRDVDIYLTVARNLLAGAGAGALADESERLYGEKAWDGSVLVPSKMGQDAAVRELLQRIAALQMVKALAMNGGHRAVDFSQFRPRGHYSENSILKNYFRTMMWMGRADLAFYTADVQTPMLLVKGDRELADAALLAQLMASSGASKAMKPVGDAINYLVGRSDNVTVEQMLSLLSQAGISRPIDLKNHDNLVRLREGASKQGAQQEIVSQVMSPSGAEGGTSAPQAFQVFGQRLIIDSFVLSKVVFDAVPSQRMMPQGLDVWASMGNDTALRLLEPEITKWHYGANLMAARALIKNRPAGFWETSTYNKWLETLATLDDLPSDQKFFPEVMQTEMWQRKQLQTQLGSWAELRHDTILYAKQSYEMTMCEYPTGYVEPYPAFYKRLSATAREMSNHLGVLDLSALERDRKNAAEAGRSRYVTFLSSFASVMDRLERMSSMELRGEPFSNDDKAWLKKVIDIRGGGSGSPQYDGWYAGLIYGDLPDRWKPTTSDVHTDPNSGRVMEVAVGDANFLVTAIDNGQDRAVYVGPVYSYYEFGSSKRLTDPEWQQQIESEKLPPRPPWMEPIVSVRTVPFQ